MKDNPQLSAEMLAKLQQTFPNLDMATGNGFVHFLTTALEEQRMKVEVETGLHAFGVTMEEIAKARADERKKVIEEVESWLVDEEYPITDPDSIDYGMMLASPKNEWNEELRAKLNQLKGGK